MTICELSRELELSPLELASDRLGIRALVRALLERWVTLLQVEAGSGRPGER